MIRTFKSTSVLTHLDHQYVIRRQIYILLELILVQVILSVVEGTKDRIFNATGYWTLLDVASNRHQEI